MASALPDIAPEVIIPYLAEPTPWWESGLISGLVGAVVGAAIGGGISWLLARQASVETLRRDEASRTAAEKSLATIAIIKAAHMVNGLSSTAAAIIDTIDSANVRGHADMEAWQKVQPVVGSVLPPRLEPAETALITAIDQKLGNDLALLEMKTFSIYSSLDVYSARRLALTDGMPAQVDGPMRVTLLDRTQYNTFAPRAAELEMLAAQLLEALDDDLTFGVELCEALGPACKAYFKAEKFSRLDYSQISGRLARLHAIRVDHRSIPTTTV